MFRSQLCCKVTTNVLCCFSLRCKLCWQIAFLWLLGAERRMQSEPRLHGTKLLCLVQPYNKYVIGKWNASSYKRWIFPVITARFCVILYTAGSLWRNATFLPKSGHELIEHLLLLRDILFCEILKFNKNNNIIWKSWVKTTQDLTRDQNEQIPFPLFVSSWIDVREKKSEVFSAFYYHLLLPHTFSLCNYLLR